MNTRLRKAGPAIYLPQTTFGRALPSWCAGHDRRGEARRNPGGPLPSGKLAGSQGSNRASRSQAWNNPRFPEADVPHIPASLRRGHDPSSHPLLQQVSRAPSRGSPHPVLGVTLTCGSFWDLRVGLSGCLLTRGSLIH